MLTANLISKGWVMTLQELFTDSSKWIKDSYAKDTQGHTVPVKHPTAVSFCLIGGLGLCYPTAVGYTKAILRIRSTLEEMGFSKNIYTFNDAKGTTFDNIRTVIQRANV